MSRRACCWAVKVDSPDAGGGGGGSGELSRGALPVGGCCPHEDEGEACNRLLPGKGGGGGGNNDAGGGGGGGGTPVKARQT